jgi:long-chain acyl-CoA synthetase
LVISWLLDNMSNYSNREAMVFHDESVSYGELLDEYRLWADRMKDYRFRAGEVIMLEGDYSPAICGAILALIENGNIIVPLSTHSSYRHQELMNIAQVNKKICVHRDTFEINDYSDRLHTGLLEDFSKSGQAGMILFTSGSTGPPKAILHHFSPFLKRYQAARAILRTMTFLLFDHIGGINTLFHTLANGGTIICPRSRSPMDICALIEKHQVELLPTTPSFLNMLIITEAYKQYDMSSLRIITYGTEVMPDYTLKELHCRLPHVQLKQTYGLSELSILRSKSKSSGSPWFTLGGEGVETKVVDGILHIRSKAAMIGYLNAPNPFDEEGWFNTYDQVLVDGDYIRILGRQSEIINVGGRKVYPVEVEDVLLQMPELSDVTIKGEANSMLGHIVTAVVNVSTPINAKELKERIRGFCKGRLEDYQIPVKVYIEHNELFSERHKKLRKRESH